MCEFCIQQPIFRYLGAGKSLKWRNQTDAWSISLPLFSHFKFQSHRKSEKEYLSLDSNCWCVTSVNIKSNKWISNLHLYYCQVLMPSIHSFFLFPNCGHYYIKLPFIADAWRLNAWNKLNVCFGLWSPKQWNISRKCGHWFVPIWVWVHFGRDGRCCLKII